MRNTILFAFLSLSFASCDDLTPYMDELNNAPAMAFIGDASQLELVKDSVKLSAASVSTAYPVRVSLADPDGNLFQVAFQSSLGSGVFMYEGQTFTSAIPCKGLQTLYFSYVPDHEGRHIFTLFAEDEFGAESSGLTVELTAFLNIAPTARLTVEELSYLTPREYELNGSLSRDGDYRFGGRITKYSYTVNSQTFEAGPRPKFVFPSAGRYRISLTVTDNDNASSQVVEQYVDVK